MNGKRKAADGNRKLEKQIFVSKIILNAKPNIESASFISFALNDHDGASYTWWYCANDVEVLMYTTADRGTHTLKHNNNIGIENKANKNVSAS